MKYSRKGKTYEEIFGVQKAIRIKKNQSLVSKGKPKQKQTEEHKRKIGIANKDKRLGKTWEQIYGFEKAQQIREKVIKSFSKSWEERFGVQRAQKMKKARGEFFSKLNKGNNNHWTGKTHTEQTKLKIRSARAKQKFPFNNTSIEVKLQEALKKENIEFTKQKYELKGTPDIFIEPNICIFADGDYWHNRLEQIPKDKEVNEFLVCNGYKVLRFWEHDIHNNLEKCIQEIRGGL